MSKRSMVKNRVILQTGAFLSILVLLSVQWSLGGTRKKTLSDFIEPNTINSAKIVTGQDTVEVKQLSAFLSDIGIAEKMGPLKYMSTRQIWLTRKNGGTERILTNGKVFTYQGTDFVGTSDVVNKYLK